MEGIPAVFRYGTGCTVNDSRAWLNRANHELNHLFNRFWSIARMNFETAQASIVRSIRQRDLLNAWLRLHRREQTLPLLRQYQPDNLHEEMPDLMHYEVRHDGRAFRFLILHGGANLVRAFGTTDQPEGRFVDDLVGAERAQFIVPYLLPAIAERRPVYTVSTVFDVGGVPVSYERLVLPFGADGSVQHLIVSLKTISIEGRFETRDLMRADHNDPTYSVCAVIDGDAHATALRVAVSDHVVEL